MCRNPGKRSAYSRRGFSAAQKRTKELEKRRNKRYGEKNNRLQLDRAVIAFDDYWDKDNNGKE